MDQKIIDYIRDELDESLDREYGALVNTRLANNCADNANMNAGNRSSKKSAQHYRYAPTRMIVHPMQQQSSDQPYFREPIVSHQQFHRQQQYQQFSDDTTSSTASVSAEQIHPRFPPATLPKPSYEKHQSSPSPPALPKKPPPFMSKSESEEIRRIAQFNEGFVASQQQLQQRASTSRDVDGRRSAFKGLTPNPPNTQKMPDSSSGNAEIERNEAKNADKNDNIVCAAPVGQRSRRFATKSTESSSGRRRYPRADDASNLRVQRIDNKSSEDEDSTSVSMSGSLGSAVHDYENSTTLERSNSDLAMLSRMVSANEQRAANQRNQVLTTSSDVNAATTTTTSTSNHSNTVQYNRQSSRRSSTPPNAYMKRAYRRYSNDSQFLNYGFVESDDEILTSRKHSNTLPSAHLSALTHHLSDSPNNDNNGRFDAEFLPPIVASIDSSRESIIARNNSPRRTSSRAKKMYGKRGFDVVIRTQSESDISDKSRHNTKKPSVIHERPVDAFYVTEF
ncbi:unnamed protein product [Anisakis simplex]|uniref:SH2 domain-containing protein n=1 Tax=Anisakis simplex TaxID=6269 RepID=A0A0M3K7V7_ANISI|nr:unnamed protein product [Anisakis simplex]